MCLDQIFWFIRLYSFATKTVVKEHKKKIKNTIDIMHTAEYFIKNQIMKIYDVPLYSRKLDFRKQKSLPSL